MEEKYNQAKNLYFQTELSQAEIARIIGVTTKTIYRWMKQDDWKRIKMAARMAPAAIIERFYVQLVDLNDAICSREPGKRIPTLDEARISRHLIMSVSKMKQQQSKSDTIQVMMNYTSWLKTKDITLAHQTVKRADEYIQAAFKNDRNPWEMEYDCDELEDDPVPPVEADGGQSPLIIPLSPEIAPAVIDGTIKPSSDRDRVKSFNLNFDGYWKEENIFSLPAESGVYCVYEASYGNQAPLKLKKVIAIGHADNVRETIETLLTKPGWREYISKDNKLSFSFAKVEPADGPRIALALIYNTRPPLNTEYKESFPYGATKIHSTGQTFALSVSFMVERKET